MRAITLVILGGTGDLARKKLVPAIHALVKRNAIDRVDLIATGRRTLSDKEYAEHMGLSKDDLHADLRLYYAQADFTEPDSLRAVNARIAQVEDERTIGRIFYVATSPEFYESIAKQLAGCCQGMPAGRFWRLLFEKPFGHDLASSRALDASLRAYFSEDRLFRVDHYLGKETVQNILVLRFSNPFFERTWNSEFIDRVRIVVDEDLLVGDRIAYYDRAGALRDMVQNHLLQMAAFILMDTPQSTAPHHIHEAKAEALGRLRFDGDITLGQYEGYAKELERAGLPPSGTETFVRLRLISDDPRWKGTAIELVTGKALKDRYATIEIDYKKEPCVIYCDISTYPNRLILNIQPRQDIDFMMNTKAPGRDMVVKHVKLSFSHDCEFHGNTPESYEVILEECIRDDKTLFITQQELEAAWRIVDDVRARTRGKRPIIYAQGSVEVSPRTHADAAQSPIRLMPQE